MAPVLLLIGLVQLIACEREKPQKAEVVRPVKAMKVGDATAFSGRWFPGRAKATNEVNLAFEVSGRLVRRPVNVGDRVKKGKVLAELDPRDFQNSLEQSKAERKRAVAHRDRIKRAAAKGAVAQQDLTDAEARLEIAQAEVKIRAKALGDSRLIAPFSGTVAATYVENFETVRAKKEILRLLDTSKIELTIDIPENIISMAPYVKAVKIRFDAFPDRLIPGRIKEISNEASETTRTYPVTIIMDQPQGITIQPGMAGQAAAASVVLPDKVKRGGHDVPASAVFSPPDETDKTYVWVIDEANKTVKRRQVKTGALTDHGIRVLEGLKSGEWIAIAGVHYLREGQQVRLLIN